MATSFRLALLLVLATAIVSSSAKPLRALSTPAEGTAEELPTSRLRGARQPRAVMPQDDAGDDDDEETEGDSSEVHHEHCFDFREDGCLSRLGGEHHGCEPNGTGTNPGPEFECFCDQECYRHRDCCLDIELIGCYLCECQKHHNCRMGSGVYVPPFYHHGETSVICSWETRTVYEHQSDEHVDDNDHVYQQLNGPQKNALEQPNVPLVDSEGPQDLYQPEDPQGMASHWDTFMEDTDVDLKEIDPYHRNFDEGDSYWPSNSHDLETYLQDRDSLPGEMVLNAQADRYEQANLQNIEAYLQDASHYKLNSQHEDSYSHQPASSPYQDIHRPADSRDGNPTHAENQEDSVHSKQPAVTHNQAVYNRVWS